MSIRSADRRNPSSEESLTPSQAAYPTQALLMNHPILTLGQLAIDQQIPGVARHSRRDQYKSMPGQKGVGKLLQVRRGGCTGQSDRVGNLFGLYGFDQVLIKHFETGEHMRNGIQCVKACVYCHLEDGRRGIRRCVNNVSARRVPAPAQLVSTNAAVPNVLVDLAIKPPCAP